MPGARATITFALLLSSTSPAAARGPSCGVSCLPWVLPLIALAMSICVALVGGYYLMLAFAPRASSWADAKRGWMKNGVTGAVLTLIGLGAFAFTIHLYSHV